MNSKQRAYLRSLSNGIDSIFQIGKNGTGDNLIKQLNEALEAREIIKITVLDNAPQSIKDLAEEVSLATDSTLVQIIGNKITLYKAKKENPKIVLP